MFHQKIDLAVRDPGPDLLVAAERAALEPVDLEAEFLLEKDPRRPRGVESVPRERALVELRPLEVVLLRVVMGDEGDPLAFSDGEHRLFHGFSFKERVAHRMHLRQSGGKEAVFV
jgi:hypothetical protein